ncbi:spore gernimation protein KB [Bacillus sp. AFS076308]|uniref:GerAB/ArcD/ProY family transporter n=1 Tax=unclassified Bacillus (in: firmicutes) TaxID=185979 RepID=UPI000BF27200|nr:MULTISPECIES: GerAB/ArcD/ProY family transporter [unclassified Bacillus (in: firmicutes)]PFO09652.1 spore gernimation protein KB [Bacillus sp. AFS076308]PGV54818.1 spore gernimation protein KB [Bacillus sp. AFS037270]
MEKIKINSYQMFVLVVLFEMGSAILFAPGSQAKQDAWISILLGLAVGLVLFWVYYRLYKFFPDVPLTSYLQILVGKWIGRFIGFLYVIYFMYQATRILRDFGELLVTSIYTNTPLFIINSLMLLTIIYAIHKGLEVIARVSELFFIFIYLFALAGFLVIMFSDLIHLENIKPIFEYGVVPVIKASMQTTIYFPFGEMVTFTMLLPFFNNQKKVKWVCLGGMLLAGINIVITSVVNISVLGVDSFTRSTFPLLTTISRIHFSNFLERLDVFYILYVIIAGFFKITIFFYSAVYGAADIFKIEDHRKLVFPVGVIILFGSITIAANSSEHIDEGLKYISFILHLPFQIIIPIALLIIAFFRFGKRDK